MKPAFLNRLFKKFFNKPTYYKWSGMVQWQPGYIYYKLQDDTIYIYIEHKGIWEETNLCPKDFKFKRWLHANHYKKVSVKEAFIDIL